MAQTKTTIEDASWHDVNHVAMNMRTRDRDEMTALFGQLGAMPAAVADRFYPFNPLVAKLDDVPVAIGVVHNARVNVSTLGFIATPDFNKVAVSVTKFVVRQLLPSLRASGVHRVECLSLDGYVWAHEWLKLLGLQQEAVLHKYGSRGEDFVVFARLHENTAR